MVITFEEEWNFCRPAGCNAVVFNHETARDKYSTVVICGNRKLDMPTSANERYGSTGADLATLALKGYCINCPNLTTPDTPLHVLNTEDD